MPISIHVPTRGTTKGELLSGNYNSNFNPRSHKGNDIVFDDVPVDLIISIHVPTRGTTPGTRWRRLSLFEFQSTFPQGERRNMKTCGMCRNNFNPRSHKGNDDIEALIKEGEELFQSTFPQGERRVLLRPRC